MLAAMARPRKTSDEDVLLSALRVFWRDGYAGASLADLETAAGLNRRGLANRFGDKRGLLMEVMRLYGAQAKAGFLDGLLLPPGAPGAGLASIRAMFRAILDFCVDGEGVNGCMVVNLTRESIAQDPEVRAIIDGYFAVMHASFEAALAAAETMGELPPEEDREALKSFLTGTLMGLFSMIRAGAPAEAREGFVAVAMERFGGPKPAAAPPPPPDPPRVLHT